MVGKRRKFLVPEKVPVVAWGCKERGNEPLRLRAGGRGL